MALIIIPRGLESKRDREGYKVAKIGRPN